MKSITIEGTLRADLGSKFARQLRTDGNVPCVIYGGEEPVHFYAPEGDFRHLIYTPEAHIVEVKVDGKTIKAVMQDLQFHPVSDKLIHVDFIQLVDGKAVSMDIPVVLQGNARGVRNGGKLKMNLRKLRVKATEENLPESIVLDIENLRIGESVKVEEAPKGPFEILNAASAVIVSIKTARNAVEDEEEEEEGEEGTEEGAEEGATAEAASES